VPDLEGDLEYWHRGLPKRERRKQNSKSCPQERKPEMMSRSLEMQAFFQISETEPHIDLMALRCYHFFSTDRISVS